ncbi:MAG: ABC transporter ATP-binding protein [Clostridia bacterium]|nr:ABC transporter ATP-binding protein [Clostridia bacterium]
MKAQNERKASRRQFTRQFYHGNRIALVTGSITTMLISLVSIIFSILIQQIIDAISGAEGTRSLVEIAWTTVILLLGTSVLFTLDAWASPRFRQRAVRQYTSYAFERLTQKSISSFSDENTAAYISGLSNDVNVIETNYLSNTFSVIQNVVWFFGSFGLMLWYSPILTLVAVCASALPILASVLTGNRLIPLEKQVSERNTGFVNSIKDALGGFTVIKSFKAEREVCKIILGITKTNEAIKCRRDRISSIIGSIGNLAAIVAQMAVFVAGAYLALSQKAVTPGIVMAFVQLMGLASRPISELPGLLAKRKAALALVDKMADAVATNVREEGQTVPAELTEAIAVDNLTFAYDEEKPVLKQVSFRFEAGKSYAIVGASGSGKSTLLNLLMAGRSNYQGEIRYDGTELREINSASLYDIASLVQQNVFVFNNSIQDNITMFQEFDEESVRRVIEMSGLSELIDERGADYACGENGNLLSGGERQRISIARALLRKTPVLLVDEATASLDAETAFHVTSSILNLKGLTRIVVTHDLEEELLKRYDGILVLKNGGVEETGAFDALMAKKGYFYSLFTVSQ